VAHGNRAKNALLSVLRENPALTFIRFWATLRDVNRENRFVLRKAMELGVGVLDYRSLRTSVGKPDADTFFILGSGASVEDLAPSDFETIRSQVSVGINAWPLHHFVPDIYTYEPVPVDDGSHYKTMSMLNRPDIIEASPRILFLKPRDDVEALQLRQIPAPLIDGTFLYGRFQPFTRSTKNLAYDLDIVLDRLERNNDPVLPDSGASIIRMACLGILMGFRHIVFVGVDLNNTDYFWERNPAHLLEAGIEKFDHGQKSETHETMSRMTRPFVVTEMVAAINTRCSRKGIGLSVASEHSLLRQILPFYGFENR